jgi:hypothetical protein
VNQVCDTAAVAAPSTSPPLLLLLFLRLNLLSEEQLLPTLIPGRSCECKAAINSLLPLSAHMRKKPKHPSLKKPQNQTNKQTTTTTTKTKTLFCNTLVQANRKTPIPEKSTNGLERDTRRERQGEGGGGGGGGGLLGSYFISL